MTVAELRYGASKARAPKLAHDLLDELLATAQILAFDTVAAEHHALRRRALEQAGTPIGERDLVIAATALAHELKVATGNAREFQRVEGLEVEVWG